MCAPLSNMLMWSSSFLLPVLFLFISFLSLMSCLSVSFSWSMVVMEFDVGMHVYVDFLSLFFIIVVSIVSTMVLYYSLIYMSSQVMKVKFIISLVMFIISMLILCLSADLFWVMVGWDGLGLTSLYLIMYFQNWKSFNSSMITFILNRLGDALILISLVWAVGFGSTSCFSSSSSIFFMFLAFGALSKSAQLPFSSWLPLAMAAPTPVSSLVHSSTLVTAGIYILIRFSSFISDDIMTIVFFIACMTVVFAGLSSLGEYDLKKIIALSTLSHIGLMMMFVSSHYMAAALLHLFTHAMFKSLLFMISGVVIHNCQSNQDVRLINLSSVDTPTGVSFMVSLMSMVGLPFFSGFYSKELFIQCSSSSIQMIFISMFFVASSLTAAYSIRLLVSMFYGKMSLSFSVNKSPYWFVFIFMVLMALISGQGAMLLVEDSVFVPMNLSNEFYFSSKFIFMFIIMGILIGILIATVQGSSSNWLIKSSNLMWFIYSFTLVIQTFIFKWSYLMMSKMDSKGMTDWLVKSKKDSLESLSKKILLVFVPFPLYIISVFIFFLIPMLLYS